MLLVSVIIVVLGSCSGPSTSQDAASDNGSGTTSDEEQRTTVSQPADTEEDDTEETTVFSSSPTVTTTNTEEAEDLTFVDIDGDGSSDYRAYLRYENYLEREDVSSVYIRIAALSGYRDFNLPVNGTELMSDVLERLPYYDFVLLSVYEDDTGEYEGPVTYTDNAEVAEIYEGHLHEYADEFANAVMESESPTEIERFERQFREEVIPLYDYHDSQPILASPAAPDIPPWVYSDREVETLGELPGLEGTIDSTIMDEIDNTIMDHYEAIQSGNFEEAYSYFSSDYRSTTDMNSWIEEQESNKVDTIHASETGALEAEVEVTSQDTAIATIRVSFEDSIYQCDNIYLCTNPSNITWKMVKEGEE